MTYKGWYAIKLTHSPNQPTLSMGPIDLFENL